MSLSTLSACPSLRELPSTFSILSALSAIYLR
jgi:hypothetical protein